MTVTLDFPAPADSPEPLPVAAPVDPALLRSVARGLTHPELVIALHASGAELAMSQRRDLDFCWSLVEIGLARLGLTQVRETAATLLSYGLAAVREIEAGGTGISGGRAYNRLVGGARRASRLSLFAAELRSDALGL